MRVLFTDPFARYDDVELTAEEALLAVTTANLWACKDCRFQRGDGTMVLHVRGATDTQEDWDQVVARIKPETLTGCGTQAQDVPTTGTQDVETEAQDDFDPWYHPRYDDMAESEWTWDV